jgi:hypothetical protein
MRTRKTTIVLISGKAHAGKSTAKDIIMEEIRKLPDLAGMSYSFANPLKYIAKAFLGWNGEKDNKGRKLLQDIGRVGREYDENIWCRHLLNQLDKSRAMFPENFVIVDDWRYPNEFSFFKSNPVFDVVSIRVFGRGGLEGELAEDTSETSLPNYVNGTVYKDYYDYVVDNSGTIEQLESNIREIFESLKLNYIVE